MSFKFLKIMAVFLYGISVCSASMTISGTRIIFPGNEKDVSVRTNNKGSQPALVQVWVDDGKTDSDINQVKVPFVVTPPVYRVEPGEDKVSVLFITGCRYHKIVNRFSGSICWRSRQHLMEM